MNAASLPFWFHAGLTHGLPAEADWNRLANEAGDTGLAGLLLERCARHEVRIPPASLGKLRSAAAQVGVRNQVMMRCLERLLPLLHRAGVRVMLLKGAALNATVYSRTAGHASEPSAVRDETGRSMTRHSAACRPMSDLDLLVRPGDVPVALKTLTNAGCRRGMHLVRPDFFPRFYFETELLAGGPDGVRIDLHARPFRPLRTAYTVPDHALWSDAQCISLRSASAWIPSAERMFIHLAAHAAFHGHPRLIWLYDLHCWAAHHRARFDWDLVVRLAQDWRLSLPVWRTLDHAAALLGPLAPDSAHGALRSNHVSWKDRLTLYQAPRDAASPLGHVACNLLCMTGVRFRLAYLAALALPGVDHLAGIYPYRHRGWTSCAHAWRFVRPVARAVSRLWHLVGTAIPTGLLARRTIPQDDARRGPLAGGFPPHFQ